MNVCIFCQIIVQRQASNTVFEDDRVIAIMDRCPVSHGHVLVIPKQHQALIADLQDTERNHLFAIGSRINRALRACSEISCAGVNMLVNDGEAANQTIPHVHLHLIPRRDKNLIRLAKDLLLRQNPLRKTKRQAAITASANAIREAIADVGLG